MTEEQWLTSTQPHDLLTFLREHPRKRKFRLLAVAEVSAVWQLLSDDRSRMAVNVADRYADGLATSAELAEAYAAAKEAWKAIPWNPGDSRAARGERAARHAARLALEAAAVSRHSPSPRDGWKEQWRGSPAERVARCDLIRDLFGNPFRPVAIEPMCLTWQGGIVGKIARTLYNECSFEQLPVLADALEEAGCTDQVLFEHCRQPGIHARGCWLLDLLLGKE